MTISIKDCNVCVVGGAGFLGSHLVNHLIEDRNCKVLVIDNLISGYHKHVHEKATFEHYDITGSEYYLLQVFQRNSIEYVFNYAAEPYIPVSFERPLHVFNTNAFGALKVINAAQEAQCKGILQVSSAEIYGAGDIGSGDLGDNFAGKTGDGTICGFGKINERAPVVPHSSYGASKAAIDAMVQVRWKEAETPCIALRQFNCVGERETHPYIVPEIISQLSNGIMVGDSEELAVRLGNNSVRDFQYAGDAVRMAVELLEKGQFGEVYNMGSESCIQIYDLAHMIAHLMGEKIEIITEEARKRPWEIWHLQSDNTKLYGVIDLRPQVTLEQALLKTLDYFYSNNETWDW